VQIYKTKTGELFYISLQKSMRVLVVAATEAEVVPLISDLKLVESGKLKVESEVEQLYQLSLATPKQGAGTRSPLTLLITGVGMVATAFALGKHLANNQYDLVINLGIAGSFDRSIALGDVLEVCEDTFAELGAEDEESFLTIDKLGFGESVFRPVTALNNIANLVHLTQATAITVNTVHGHERSIKELTERIPVQLESMEGAAFFYACKQFNLPCMQIRAVSNYVEKRNRDAWKIGLAIKNLNTFAVELLKGLNIEKL
jgi:futalosine hydrolase